MQKPVTITTGRNDLYNNKPILFSFASYQQLGVIIYTIPRTMVSLIRIYFCCFIHYIL